MSARFIGRLLDVGLGKETTRGTAAAVSHWLAKTSSDFEDKASYARITGSHGSIYQIANERRVSKFSEGKIAGEMDADAIGLLLLSIFGNVSTAAHGGDASVKDHTFTLDNTNLHDTLSILYQDVNLERKFTNCLVNSLKLSVAMGEFVKMEADFKGKGSIGAARVTPSYGTKYYFPHQAFGLKLAATGANLAAASVIPVKSASITFEQNADYIKNVGTLSPADVVNKGYLVHGEFELDSQNATYLNYHTDGDYMALEFKVEDLETTIGTGHSPALTIDLNQVYFEKWDRDAGIDDIVSEKISWFASLDASQALLYSVVLTNLTASY